MTFFGHRLASNVYSSNARFVFELLQNADDNKFSRAYALRTPPYISFRVYSRRIVVECNEDGFTDENLLAICAVGKSSKSGSEGYIEEKGIGFKSVFKAAWKARIQSGVFSFSFSHRDDLTQSGMGMISPVWEDDFEELSSQLTRLTLYLHDTGDTDTLQNGHRIIREQFHELQETILLFMKNLRIIRVSFHDVDDRETSSVMYSIERPRSDHAVLRRTVIGNNTRREHVKHYHVTTHQATNVPRHQNRTYSNGAPSTSQVVLAFPLTETSVPIIEPQDVFVYLPVRPMGFKFIIQADFVTDASRQDIVRDSSRNIVLLDGVADAFARAALQFCEHDNLRLQWMRFLPNRNDENWGSLWRSLVDKIAHRLSATRVLYCHKRFDRHFIRDLVCLQSVLLENEEPLFEDGDPEEIVSQRYSNSDMNILMEYGLKFADWAHIIRWVAADLNRGAQSRMRSATTTASWHTQAAKLLHLPFASNFAYQKIELENLAMLPLRGGTWVSATSGPVFFAKVDGIDIPPNIGLRIIDDTITNIHRRTLFQDLGVHKAPSFLVRRQILERYKPSEHLPNISLQTSKQHLEFLYLTHHLRDANEPSYSNIFLFDQDERICKPSETVTYMATDTSPYSPWELLREAGSVTRTGSEAPGFMAHKFMNEEYFSESPRNPSGQSLTWVEWFHTHLRIPKYVHLGDTHLSDAAKYLQEHRPDRFLGALRIHHHHNRHLSPEFIACVRETVILCRNNKSYLLRGTYFPTKRLENLVERFVRHGAFFPWLWLDNETSYDSIPEYWDRFLREVDIGIPLDDLDFALVMLSHTVCAMRSDVTLESRSMLFCLYSYIQAQYRVEGGSIKAKDDIRLVQISSLRSLTPRYSNRRAHIEKCSHITKLSAFHLPIPTHGCHLKTAFGILILQAFLPSLFVRYGEPTIRSC